LILTISNQKGGVGKTTLAYNLSFILSKTDKVLMIDIDQQGHLGTMCGIDIEQLTKDDFVNLKIQKINDNLDILPCNIELSSLEIELVNSINRERWLDRNIVAKIKKNYDFIVIDTSPNLNLLNINAFSISDLVLIPINPDFLSIAGLKSLFQILNQIKEQINSNIEYKIIMNKYIQNRTFNNQVNEALNKFYSEYLLDIKIKNTQKFIDNSAIQKTVLDNQDLLKDFEKLKDYIKTRRK
jgi:chromosome partitioning protein